MQTKSTFSINLSKSPRYVIFGDLFRGFSEHYRRQVALDQFAEHEECGKVGNPRGLLHVMRYVFNVP